MCGVGLAYTIEDARLIVETGMHRGPDSIGIARVEEGGITVVKQITNEGKHSLDKLIKEFEKKDHSLYIQDI